MYAYFYRSTSQTVCIYGYEIFQESWVVGLNSVLARFFKMLRLKLIGMVEEIQSGGILLKRLAVPRICCASKHDTSSRKANKDEEMDEFDVPIKYSTSPASSMKAGKLHSQTETTPYPGMIIIGSLAIFCIYFGILREESDIDQKLSAELTPEMKEYLREIKSTEQRHKQTHKSPV